MLKNLQCDICSKQVQYKFQLDTLKEIYQTEDIVQVCEDCLYVIDKRLDKLQRKCWNGEIDVGNISKEMKDYIIKLRVLGGEIGTEGFWSKIWLRWFG